jgi:capsid protein
VTARAVRTDTAEVLAAYVQGNPRRVIDVSGDGAERKAAMNAAEKMASEFVDSIVAAWREERKKGVTLDVVVTGTDFRGVQTVANVLSGIEGVKQARMLYFIEDRALLGVDFPGDSSELADRISRTDFGQSVDVIGMSAYRLELEVGKKK